ncbi:hypothetical protein AAC387_Pa07g1759 [Persea americana]
MGQIGEVAQPRWYWVRVERVASEVELLEAAKVEEARVYWTFNPTTSHIIAAAEIKPNHVTSALITGDAIPRATISG